MQPVSSAIVKGISGRGVRRAGTGYMSKSLPPSFKQYRDYQIFKLRS